MSAIRISNSAVTDIKHNIRNVLSILLACAVLYFLLTPIAYAAEICSDFGHMDGRVDHICGSFTLFDSLDASIASMSDGWQKTIAVLVKNTFWLLAVIEICWAAAVWALEKDNMSAFTSEMIQKIMFIGFYWMILQQAPELVKAVIDSFAQAGLLASGVATCDGVSGGSSHSSTTGLSPDCIMAKGLHRVNLMWNMCPTGFTSVMSKLGEICVCAIASLIIIIGYFIMSFQLLMANIEAYILLAAGAIFLGLGSSRWTNDYVGKYFTYTMGVGLRILVLILCMAAAGDISFGIYEKFGDGMSNVFLFEYKYIFRELVVGLLMCALGAKAPDMSTSMMSGQGVGMSGGGMKQSASSISQSIQQGWNMGPGAVMNGAKGMLGGSKGGGGGGGGGGGIPKPPVKGL